MLRRPALRLVIAPLVAVALALAVGTWASAREPDSRSSLTSALDALPAGTLVAGFTDWAAVRDDLRLGADSPAAARASLADDASLRDLTTRSVLGGVIADMHEAYGWSAADLLWESYGQAPGGAAMVARFDDSVSLDDVQDRLDELGYTRRDGVWSLAADGGAAVTPELATTLGNVALDPRRRLVVAADRPGYVRTVVATIRGDETSALSVRPLADVAASLAGSDTAVIQSGAFGCRATSFDSLGADVRAQAAAAVARVGELVTPTFTGRGLTDGSRTQTIRFSAAFGSPAEAARQTRVRSALATGPFIGRSGRVEDVLDLRSASVSGSVTTLRFALEPDEGAFMSGEGPVLFAGCP